MKLALIDDSAMFWMVLSAGNNTTFEYEVEDEKAKRWLRIQAEWEAMQDEIKLEVRNGKP